MTQSFKEEQYESFKEEQYKKILAYLLYEDALRMSKKELRTTSFYDESTTENWTLKELQEQFVRDQIEFFVGGNLENEVNETWESIYDTEK
tara:strand:- start:7836 stop:8108 length:273 start_codon:yes stop_codon:yes gene_type:complete